MAGFVEGTRVFKDVEPRVVVRQVCRLRQGETSENT
jgi:hypothetical protein